MALFSLISTPHRKVATKVNNTEVNGSAMMMCVVLAEPPVSAFSIDRSLTTPFTPKVDAVGKTPVI